MRKITILLLTIILAFGCDDLDLKPITEINQEDLDEMGQKDPDKVFKSMEAGLYYSMGSYDEAGPRGVRQDEFFGQKGVDYILAIMGNDLTLNIPSWGYNDYVLGSREANYWRPAQIWGFYYNLISSANIMLEMIDPETKDEKLMGYRATALGFRGIGYYYLTQFYQYAYSDATKDKLCVPIVTEETPRIGTSPLKVAQPRAPLKDVFEQIFKDLKESKRIFAEELSFVKRDPTLLDATVISMYLARMYMYTKEYDKAIIESQLIIDNYGVLSGRTQLLAGFHDLNAPGVVFAFDQNAETTKSNIFKNYFSFFDPYSMGYAEDVYKIAYNHLIERLPDTDERLHWWMSTRSAKILYDEMVAAGQEIPAGYDGTKPWFRDTNYPVEAKFGVRTAAGEEFQWDYMTCKFIGAGRSAVIADPSINGNVQNSVKGWYLGDHIYLRAEEAHFIKAEALAQSGNAGGAIAALIVVIKERDPSYAPTVSGQADVLDEVLFHKRVEFWGEGGLEYMDNRRLNIPIDRAKPGSNHYLVLGQPTIQKIEQDDERFLYQIPKDEIASNPMIGQDNQNP